MFRSHEADRAWDLVPTIIVKAVCDYADSHKNKKWQGYAALAGASCAKALVLRWTPTGDLLSSAIEDTPAAAQDQASWKGPGSTVYNNHSNIGNQGHHQDLSGATFHFGR
ncbi:hypothetical protein BJY00DRAFT_313017 [Aspergillus carlsbadensis]|nr:hypothetical protein BJY00DRAFT_313017 [Aspergillus carlsbadensis]